MGESTCDELAAAVDHPQRDACLHSLGALYAAGRLTTDELDRRIEAALAATTEAELDAVMADLSSGRTAGQDRSPAHPDNSRPWSRVRLSSHLRTAGTVAALGLGGGLVAVVGRGSNLVELLVGVAVGLIGFLAHRWWSLEPAPPGRDGDTGEDGDEYRGEDTGEDSDEDRDEDADDVPVQVVAAEPSEAPDCPGIPEPPEPAGSPQSAEDRARPPTGRGRGTIPSQRSGD